MSETKWTEREDPRGARAREFVIERRGSRLVTGAVWTPDEPRPGAPLVALGHGASGDRYQVPIPYLAKRLAGEAGYSVVAMDGPVHGLRQVGPGGREALAAELQRPGAVADMVDDWKTALGVVRALPEIGVGPFAYFGLSMGSMFGIPLLAADVEPSVAVLGLLGTSGPALRGSGAVERLVKDAGRISCPLLFLMQLEDELFDRTGYLALFDAFASQDKRLHANPGLHPALPAEEVDFAFHFLRTQLDGAARREILDPLGVSA